MTVINNFVVRQTVFYNADGLPVLLFNEANKPHLAKDINGFSVVVADAQGNPKVVMNNIGVLFIIAPAPFIPIQNINNFQNLHTLDLSQQVVEANIESVENSNNSSQSYVVRRDDVYKKVKKLGAESVKQLLLYESIFTNNHRLFIYYDEDDAFNFLTDQIMLQPNPIVHFDFLVAIKTYGSIPDALLKWFSDDLRAGLYFSSFIKLEAFQDCLYGEAEYLYWIKSIIKVSKLTVEGSISIHINISTDQKLRDANINNIATLKKMYLNNRTQAKRLKWLDQTDVEQIEWAYDYLNDRKKIIFEGVFFPKTLSDKYNLILASIDIADDIKEEFTVPNGANELVFTRRGIFIYKMRRAWDSILNTKKRAEQKSKMTITIDQSNFDSLSKLRSHYKLTPTKMLNKLIEDEFSTINDYLKKYT